jgi:hypothetical protein
VKSRKFWWTGHVEHVANTTMNILKNLMGKLLSAGGEKDVVNVLCPREFGLQDV